MPAATAVVKAGSARSPLTDAVQHGLASLSSAQGLLADVLRASHSAPAPLKQLILDATCATFAAITEVNQSCERLISGYSATDRAAKQLDATVASQNEHIADLSATVQRLTSFAALRVLTSALRTFMEMRKKKIKEVYPVGRVSLVTTAIYAGDILRTTYPHLFRPAVHSLISVCRRLLCTCRGYEAEDDGNGRFLIAFPSAKEAVEWACEVQKALLEVRWSSSLLELPACRVERDSSKTILMAGLRLQIGISTGFPEVRPLLKGNRVEYSGSVLQQAHALCHIARAAEVMINPGTFEDLWGKDTVCPAFRCHATPPPLPLLEVGREALTGAF
eukprot:RCo039865